MKHSIEIILFEPQIPQNTGNVVRSCSVTGASLTLVEPLGFSIDDRYLKRAGLDYWEGVNFKTIKDLETYLLEQKRPFYFFTSKVKKSYWEANLEEDAILVFGSETKGLPQALVDKYPEQCVTIPMKEGARCLNLATSAGIALFEAIRNCNS